MRQAGGEGVARTDGVDHLYRHATMLDGFIIGNQQASIRAAGYTQQAQIEGLPKLPRAGFFVSGGDPKQVRYDRQFFMIQLRNVRVFQ